MGAWMLLVAAFVLMSQAPVPSTAATVIGPAKTLVVSVRGGTCQKVTIYTDVKRYFNQATAFCKARGGTVIDLNSLCFGEQQIKDAISSLDSPNPWYTNGNLTAVWTGFHADDKGIDIGVNNCANFQDVEKRTLDLLYRTYPLPTGAVLYFAIAGGHYYAAQPWQKLYTACQQLVTCPASG